MVITATVELCSRQKWCLNYRHIYLLVCLSTDNLCTSCEACGQNRISTVTNKYEVDRVAQSEERERGGGGGGGGERERREREEDGIWK